MENFEFLLLDGFSNLVLASALEPLRDVKTRSFHDTLNWELTALNGQAVTSSSKMRVTPDRNFDPARTNGTLVIIAGYSVREQSNPNLTHALRQASRSAKRILALDTAAWLLAKAGLLDGVEATIHWQEISAFQETFPNVTVTNARYAQSGRIFTAGGATASFDLMLELIRQLYGAAAAFDAQSMFSHDPSQQGLATKATGQAQQRVSSKLLKALNLMAEHLETPLTTHELAARISMSERTLARLFTRELGMTTGKYYQLYRLQHARYLAQETRLSLEEIAHRCGFSNASSLRRSFTAELGQSIATFRNASGISAIS